MVKKTERLGAREPTLLEVSLFGIRVRICEVLDASNSAGPRKWKGDMGKQIQFGAVGSAVFAPRNPERTSLDEAERGLAGMAGGLAHGGQQQRPAREGLQARPLTEPRGL